jgi:hypothetical protein
MSSRAGAVGIACAALLACSLAGNEVPQGDAPYDPPPESCAAVDVDAPTTFVACSTGSGIFGRWIVDDAGLPAYDYGLDENADARASWFNTEGLDRRDQWFSFGNARVTALATNDGPIEVTTQDRGITYLDKIDASQGHFGGGFSYLDDGHTTWSTAYAWRPRGSETTRRFGMGYARSSMDYRGVRVTRTTFAPAGDAPAVIDEVALENTSAAHVRLRHYEVWDVARRPIETNWIVSGLPLTSVPASVRAARDARNAMFDENVSLDAASGVLGLRRTWVGSGARPAEGDPSAVDDYPGDPYLAALVAPVDAVYTRDAAFFGAGGPTAPDAVTARAPGDGASLPPESGDGQPRMFVVRSDLDLAPGETRTLRFAYGYAPMGEPFAIDDAWRDPSRDLLADARAEVASHLVYFATNAKTGAPVPPGALQREMAWDAAQLEVSTAYRDYFGHHVVPQGSAYLYLHGADGALRDLALFAIPLVYTHPELAREELALMTGMQYPDDGRFSYAFQGNGVLDDALGIHAHPSDLDLFFLWALSEYVGATGDVAFLDAAAPYYPKDASPAAVVWDHVVSSVRHLFDVVGTGPHGLVRVGDGDWNDGIVFSAPDRALAEASGESVPNTQMAAAVLPRVADLVEPRDAALAAEIRSRVDALRAALPQTWTGSFFGRAYFGDDTLFHADQVDLESQVWALVGGTVASDADRAALVARIGADLDDPSPTGAMLTPGGQVWPAISGLLTWGYAESDAPRAFRHLARNTMAAHALAFPDVWYGIWSGPDGLESSVGDRPGQAWYSAATPMTDFPVQNANQHAMPILALLRVCGVDASATGLVLDPHVPGDFSLRTSLVDVARRGQVLSGAYRPPNAAARTLEVRAPRGHTVIAATLDGQSVPVAPGSASVVLTVTDPNAAFSVMTSY